MGDLWSFCPKTENWNWWWHSYFIFIKIKRLAFNLLIIGILFRRKWALSYYTFIPIVWSRALLSWQFQWWISAFETLWKFRPTFGFARSGIPFGRKYLCLTLQTYNFWKVLKPHLDDSELNKVETILLIFIQRCLSTYLHECYALHSDGLMESRF